MKTQSTLSAKAPWHIWVIGTLLLLWYASGMITIVAAQHFTLPSLTAEEAAYYAGKPLWLEIITDIGLIACVAGAMGLLLRRSWTVKAFWVASILVLAQNAFELAVGTSRMLANNASMIVTTVIIVTVLLSLLYARAMRRRRVLR